MTTQVYYFPLSDFKNGRFDGQSLASEIRSPSSGLTVQLASTPATTVVSNVPHCSIAFKGGVNDLSALEAIVAAHEGNEAQVADLVEPVVRVVGKPTMIDGVALQGTSGIMRADLLLATDMHIQGSLIHWDNAQYMDRGYSVLCIPEARAPSLTGIAVGATTLTLPPQAAAGWLPASGNYPKMIEVWDKDYEVVSELVFLDGVEQASAGSPVVLQLQTPIAKVHAPDSVVVPVYSTFHQVRGDLEGGIYFVGSGDMDIENQSGVTALVPAGLSLGTRIILAPDSNEVRRITSNFRFRLPEEKL